VWALIVCTLVGCSPASATQKTSAAQTGAREQGAVDASALDLLLDSQKTIDVGKFCPREASTAASTLVIEVPADSTCRPR